MSGAIEKVLDRLPSGGPDDVTVICERFVVNVKEANAARAELADLRADHAAQAGDLDKATTALGKKIIEAATQAKQIETMREAVADGLEWLQEAFGSMSQSDLMCVIYKAEEALSPALSSLTPSDMRVVPVERLRGLEECALRLFMFSDSVLGEGKAAELLGVDIIALNQRAAAIRVAEREKA